MFDLETFRGWTLFLDRDGVINERIPGDYVKRMDEFKFVHGAREAIARFSEVFKHILVVTNQQGIGKGIMDELDLDILHAYMVDGIEKYNGRIDKVYFCPGLAKDKPNCRKPQIGMALQAKADFPDIDFNQSLMIGDSLSDIQFAHNAGMKAFFVHHLGEIPDDLPSDTAIFTSLADIVF